MLITNTIDLERCQLYMQLQLHMHINLSFLTPLLLLTSASTHTGSRECWPPVAPTLLLPPPLLKVAFVSLQLIYIQHHHHHLMQHLSKLELEKGQLFGHLTELKQKWTRCSDENTRLHAQVATLTNQFQQQQQQQHFGDRTADVPGKH